MNELKIIAPAKINLSLQVLNRREDGYHNINSIMCPIALQDEIIIRKGNNFTFKCDIDLGIHNEQNLAYKAAVLTMQKYNLPGKISISLIKRIPSGGGLGGGSSDAANIITGLCNFFGISPAKEELFELAGELGSDVPFFINKSSAIVQSRGEKLEYIDFQIPWQIIIIAPNFKISTATAYRNMQRSESYIGKIIDYKSILPQIIEKPELMNKYFVNDFVFSGMDYYKDIKEIIEKLSQTGAIYSNMSGSGSCCFGLYTQEVNIEHLKSIFPDYKVYSSSAD